MTLRPLNTQVCQVLGSAERLFPLNRWLALRVMAGFCWLIICAGGLVRGEFVLNLIEVQPQSGTAELQFRGEPGYYYCLEKATSLDAGFVQMSGWMLGDYSVLSWPIHYSVSLPAGSGSPGIGEDAFTVYPFSDGRTLVTWYDNGTTKRTALVSQDFTGLPPIVSLPGDSATRGLTVLLGLILWNPAYEMHDPALLPAESQAVLGRLTDRYDEVLAAGTANGSGGPIQTAGEMQFFRIRRMPIDADGDGLSWAQEVFQYGTDPDDSDCDDDGSSDAEEVANGTDPFNPFNGSPPVITAYGGDGQIAWAGSFLREPIQFRVQNATGSPVFRVPVEVIVDHGQVSLANDGTGMLGASATLYPDAEGFVRFFIKHNQDYNTDCHMSVGIDYGFGQQSLSYTSRILGNPDAVAAPQEMAGVWNESGHFVVSWQDASSNETEFVIEQRIEGQSQYIPIARLPANATQWTDIHPFTDRNAYYRANSTR